MTFMADATNVIAESTESNNTRQLRFTPVWCDLGLVDLTFDKSSYEAGEPVTVTTYVRNNGYWASSPYAISVQALDQLGLLNETRSMPALAARTTSTLQDFSFIAPTFAEDTLITVRSAIPPGQTYSGLISLERSVLIKAGLPDLSIIDSTIQDYFTGRDVVISALIQNSKNKAVPAVAIHLELGEAVLTESISVPGNGANWVVFRVRTPDSPGIYPVAITVDPDQLIEEADDSNNELVRNVTIAHESRVPMPDPDDSGLEQAFISRGKLLMPLAMPASSSYHSWQEVRLINGDYVIRDFWMSLETSFSINPDPRIAIAGQPRQMESGFGLQAFADTSISTNYDRPEKLVAPQMVYVFYPETNYGQIPFAGFADSLVITNEYPWKQTVTWIYPDSPFSQIGSRLHFTPIWIPDGPYFVMAQIFYAWSPVGQMYHFESNEITIQGNMYDRVTVVRR